MFDITIPADLGPDFSAGIVAFEFSQPIEPPAYFTVSEGNRGTTVCVEKFDAQTGEVPNSFFRGLADFNTGRVIDADQALEQAPPTV